MMAPAALKLRDDGGVLRRDELVTRRAEALPAAVVTCP
jgi:hypothetical protein